MIDFQGMKDRAVKRAMRDGAARYVDLLADQVLKIAPPAKVFTRDDVAELLRGMAERMREEDT